MLIPYNSRYSDWKYVEVARFIESRNAVIRYQRKGEPVFLEWGDQVRQYRDSHDSVGIYTSVFRYNEMVLDCAKIASLYFDFDDEDNIDETLQDVKRLYSYLTGVIEEDYIRVYFTGHKGFHVEVEGVPLGVDPGKDLHKSFRSIAENLKSDLQLTTIDLAVYDPRRMWRLPNTRHQKTGLYKTELDNELLFGSNAILQIHEYSKSPKAPRTPEIVSFQPQANEWYKNQIAIFEGKMEQERLIAAERRAELFGKYGTSMVSKPNQKAVDRTWRRVVESMKSTTPGKDRNVTLSRQAYTMFLTLLEADSMPEDYFDPMLELAMGVGLEEREARATLLSAIRAAKHKHYTNPKVLYERKEVPTNEPART